MEMYGNKDFSKNGKLAVEATDFYVEYDADG